jgi:predicted nucleotidyltransferase
MAKKQTTRRYVQPYRHASPNIPLTAIRRFARRIAERFHPDKIILFGSYDKPHEERRRSARNHADQERNRSIHPHQPGIQASVLTVFTVFTFAWKIPRIGRYNGAGENAMIALIEKNRPKLEALCRKHHVKILEIFGSAADGTFDPNQSDLDFLVEYLPLEEDKHARSFFGLLHDLEDLFGRKIDLVMPSAIRNPYFLEGVNKSRLVIYAA